MSAKNKNGDELKVAVSNGDDFEKWHKAEEELLKGKLEAAKKKPPTLEEKLEQWRSLLDPQKKRKCIEECFGWLKDIALLRKLKHRGLFKVAWIFTFAAAAYNLVRMRKLIPAAA